MSDGENPGTDKLQQDIDGVLAKIEDFESEPRSRRGPSWVRRVWSAIQAKRWGRRFVPRVRGGGSRRGGDSSARGGYWRGRYITYDGESRYGVRRWLRRRRR